MNFSQRSKTLSNHHYPCSYSKFMSLFHIFQSLSILVPLAFLSLSLGIFLSCFTKHSLVLGVYFTTAHYVLDQSSQLSSHRQSINNPEEITFITADPNYLTNVYFVMLQDLLLTSWNMQSAWNFCVHHCEGNFFFTMVIHAAILVKKRLPLELDRNYLRMMCIEEGKFPFK